jgi:hypothetical protein
MAIGENAEYTSLLLGINGGDPTDRAKLLYQARNWLATDGSLTIDQANINNGSLSPTPNPSEPGSGPGLIFGSSGSEGIASKRSTGGNRFGLDFYTNSTIRLSITNTGDVSIGTDSTPGNLNVNGAIATTGALTVGTSTAPANVTVNGAMTTGALTVGTATTSANLTINGNVGIGTSAAPLARLQVANGAIMPSVGNTESAGILFPKDIAGGSGDAAWLRYHPRTGEAFTLELGISNDADDHIALMSSGNVGIGTRTPADKLDVAGILRILTGSNPIRFTSGWSGFPEGATNQAEISNDTGTYKTLMLVGNRSAGSVRRVSVWDRLEVNGDLQVTGTISGKLAGLGIAVTTAMQHGQAIPIPAGFTKEECTFMAFVKWIYFREDDLVNFNCYADRDGKVFALPEGKILATGIALGKKGGW